MPTPADTARRTLGEVLDRMSPETGRKFGLVQARRELHDVTAGWGDRERNDAFDALDAAWKDRFGEGEEAPGAVPMPARPPRISRNEAEAAAWSLIERAVEDAFATTIDGSVERADYLHGLALKEARRTLDACDPRPGFLARRRLLKRARARADALRADCITER
ncbi:MAG: hypothetical protein ACPGID_12985 [Rubricella sp.]